jgi:hypothetical protein
MGKFLMANSIWMHAIDMPNLLVINLFDILNIQQFQSMILLEDLRILDSNAFTCGLGPFSRFWAKE